MKHLFLRKSFFRFLWMDCKSVTQILLLILTKPDQKKVRLRFHASFNPNCHLGLFHKPILIFLHSITQKCTCNHIVLRCGNNLFLTCNNTFCIFVFYLCTFKELVQKKFKLFCEISQDENWGINDAWKHKHTFFCSGFVSISGNRICVCNRYAVRVIGQHCRNCLIFPWNNFHDNFREIDFPEKYESHFFLSRIR